MPENETENLAVSIKKAEPEDAAALAFIICESWKSAYKDLIPPDRLALYTDIDRRREMFEKILLSGKGNFYLAAVSGSPCGLIFFGDSRDENMQGAAEIVAFYTLEEYWGKGVGQRIMDRALYEIRRLGYKSVILWVFEANIRARRFYEKCGFVFDGAVKDSSFADTKEVRYRLEL
jgi:RimJ/RimL family protein N-acetyltransferase